MSEKKERPDSVLAAVESLVTGLRDAGALTASDECLASVAVRLAGALEAAPAPYVVASLSRELRAVLEQLPRVSSSNNPVDVLLARRAERRAAAREWVDDNGRDEN